MNKLKRIMAALISAAVIITSVGCGGTEGSLASEGSDSASVSTEATSETSSDNGSSEQNSETEQSSSEGTEASTSASESLPEYTANNSESIPAEDSTPTEESTSQTTAGTTVAATAKPTTAETTESKPQESAPASGISVLYKISNSWEEDGKKCTQFDFVVKNNSASGIGSWNVKIDFGQAVEVMQCWNADARGEGNTLAASNAEYNGQIAGGAETSFGCIVKTPDNAEPKSVSVNGTNAPVSGNNGGGNQGQTPPADQATTAATKPANPPEKEDIEATGKYGLVSDCGQLSVKGADLVDKSGTPVQLRGVSTHGIQWFPQFANKNAFKHLRDEWNVNVIRLAMYSGAGEGYTDSTKAGIEQTVQNAVDACIELDMYVIIDWHVLQDQSPQVRKADALRFFGYMSEKYGDYPNVIYEICNEPNGYATWDGDIKPYAEEVIPVIRKNDPDSVIIVGTPTWSQDIDKAMANPLKYDNVMYALHYYAATHTDWLRDRLKNCYSKGLPIMVTEFGNCDASGGGANNWNEAQKWFDLLDSLNISYMTWALADKNETCCLLKPGADANGGWTDDWLSDNGKHMKDWLRNHK